MEIFDSLTGLYSKKGFSYKAQETLESDSNTSYQIVYSDVRHLKLVNDLYGIPEGDKLIQKIGKALKDSNTPDAIYARLDGDQFATLVSKENAQSIIDLSHFIYTKKFVFNNANENDTIELCCKISKYSLFVMSALLVLEILFC